MWWCMSTFVLPEHSANMTKNSCNAFSSWCFWAAVLDLPKFFNNFKNWQVIGLTRQEFIWEAGAENGQSACFGWATTFLCEIESEVLIHYKISTQDYTVNQSCKSYFRKVIKLQVDNLKCIWVADRVTRFVCVSSRLPLKCNWVTSKLLMKLLNNIHCVRQ